VADVDDMIKRLVHVVTVPEVVLESNICARVSLGVDLWQGALRKYSSC
jgi:hypothetical protein